jgi:hypothetical protein
MFEVAMFEWQPLQTFKLFVPNLNFNENLLIDLIFGFNQIIYILLRYHLCDIWIELRILQGQISNYDISL